MPRTYLYCRLYMIRWDKMIQFTNLAPSLVNKQLGATFWSRALWSVSTLAPLSSLDLATIYGLLKPGQSFFECTYTIIDFFGRLHQVTYQVKLKT